MKSTLRKVTGGALIAWADYEAYIRWNYPGDADALLARAGNGRYDGPDDWNNDTSNKVAIAGSEEETTPEPEAYDPLLNPAGNWFAGPLSGPVDPLLPPPVPVAYPTWQDWYQAAFGAGVTPAPAWQEAIPQVVAYTAVDTNSLPR